MGRRNYQPTLRVLTSTLSKFITRYRVFIDAGLSSEQAAYLAALVTALDNMITSLGSGSGV